MSGLLSTLPLGFILLHKRPANLLRVGEDAGLDGFMFSGRGHLNYGVALVAALRILMLSTIAFSAAMSLPRSVAVGIVAAFAED